jgi:Zn-dependent M28 family amino/carboxypeptidase
MGQMEARRIEEIDRRIVADLYLSRGGADFVEAIVDRYGARFGGSDQERAAADFILERFGGYGIAKAAKEAFGCAGWTRKPVRLTVTAPVAREVDCIALPFCPPGTVEAPLVYLGDGDPQTYADNRDKLRGAIAMVSTATPRFYHRGMHRGEKLGRALEAGAIGFIWMRGEPGGLPETGSARFNRACEVPAISVSYETGHELLRIGKQGQVRLRIESDCVVAPTTSYNVVGEITGAAKPDEVIVVGGHYDGHDVSQSANDNAAGTAVVMEAARALAPYATEIGRTIRFIAFAQEEMGLIGSDEYVKAHAGDNFVFMLNLDGAGRGTRGTFALQNWSEATAFFKSLLREMHDGHVAVGDTPSLYSDMYPFAAAGFPAASYSSADPVSGGAPRGYGHTYWDSLDKVNPRALQTDSILVARLLLRLANMDKVPLARKRPADMGARLRQMGLDEVLRYELREVPGER